MDREELEQKWEEAQRLMTAESYVDAARMFRAMAGCVTDLLEKAGLLTAELEALVFAGDFNAARLVISEIQSLRVDDQHVPLLIKRELAEIARGEGDHEQSLRLLDELIVEARRMEKPADVSPFLSTVKRDRGLVLAELSRFSEALPLLLEAERIHPNGQQTFYIAYCFEGLGKYSEATSYYQNALERKDLPATLKAPAEAGKLRCFERAQGQSKTPQ
jgi:tetratricopeptide (TPR) repeat protein